MALWPWVILGILVGAYLILRYNRLWVHLVDRAWRNPRHHLPLEYERPRYVLTTGDGVADMRARWPGWDGWYFFAMPDDREAPTKMVRGSLMTGLYGLEGIDNHHKLRWRLSTSRAFEYLCVIPHEIGNRRAMRFSQQYLPRARDLQIRTDALDIRAERDIAVGSEPARSPCSGSKGKDAPATYPQGAFQGTWPDYRLHLADPETGARIDLAYRGETVLWWADLPGIFTYFATFGAFEGTLRWERGNQPGEPPPAPEVIRGRGSFEHGFARKPFDFEPLYLPVRLLRRMLPGLRPIRYHYELFLGDDGELHGGFMRAAGFGIVVRNHGGIYRGKAYTPIRGIRLTYDEDTAERGAADCSGRDTVFYRRWRVEAGKGADTLAYTGERRGPAAQIAEGMIYYDFDYEGTSQGEPIRGRGYGEYVHL
jgi:hypothetical protein